MKKSGRPVFLVLGAEGCAEEPLFNVDGEVLSLEKLVEDKTAGELDIKAKTSVKHHHVSALAQTYLRRLAFLHFAGHGGNGKVNTQDFAFSAQNLATIIKSDSSRRIRFVFLNACDTATMAPHFHQAGVDHILATTTGVDDKEAQRFAVRFYTAFIFNEKSFIKSFETAKAGIPEELGINIEHRQDRGFAVSPLNPDSDSWGLYSKADAGDFYLNDLLHKQISDTPEPEPIQTDAILSKLNRSEQDDFVYPILFPQESQVQVKATALIAAAEHCPTLYFQRLETLYQCTTLQYAPPEVYSGVNVHAHLTRLGVNEKKKWMKTVQARTLDQFLTACPTNSIVIFTQVKAEGHQASKLIAAHHEFWRSISTSKKRVLAIMVIMPIRTSRRSWFTNWSTRLSQRKQRIPERKDTMIPSLTTIFEEHLDEWEIKKDHKEVRFFRKLHTHNYRKKANDLPKCDQGGTSLSQLRNLVNNLVSQPDPA